jgi:hypothetical protein
LSIFTDLIQGKIDFHTAAAEAESWAEHLVNADPHTSAVANALVSEIKQSASDAITIGDTALAPVIMTAAGAIAVALEAALATATRGISTPFNPIISAGIDTIASALQAEITVWSLQAKAALAANSVATPASH